MDTQVIAGVAAVILSLGFAYVPGLSDWYEKQTSQGKQLLMLALLFVTVGGMVTLSAFGVESFYVMDKAGLWQAVKDFVLAVVVNAGVYKSTSYIGKA